MVGENLQNNLVFKFKDGFIDGTAQLHYVVDENKLFIDNIQKVDDSYVIPLSSQLLRSNSLSMQLVVNQDDSVFKSKIFKVSIADSIINAIQYTDYYKDWFQSIRDRLDLIEDLDLDEIVQIASNINSVISNHDADTSAHEDIRNAMLTSSDISSAISTHDSDSSAHSDIRTTLNGKASANDISAAISTHNSSSDSHSDIRGLISNKASTSDINSAISNHDADTSAHSDIRNTLNNSTQHLNSSVTDSNGIHDIRFSNDKLQVYDSTDETWNDVLTSSSSSGNSLVSGENIDVRQDNTINLLRNTTYKLGNNSICVGASSYAKCNDSISIGYLNKVGYGTSTSTIEYNSNKNNIAIGSNNTITNYQLQANNILIGNNNRAYDSNCIILGHHIDHTGLSSIILGSQYNDNISVSCHFSVVICRGLRECKGNNNVVVGVQNDAHSHNNIVEVGYELSSSNNNQVILGKYNKNDSTTTSDVLIFGNGTNTSSSARSNLFTINNKGILKNNTIYNGVPQPTYGGWNNPNYRHFLGTCSTLDINLSTTPTIGDEMWFSFYNPIDEPTTIQVNTSYNGTIDNNPGTHGLLKFMWDGYSWDAFYSERDGEIVEEVI